MAKKDKDEKKEGKKPEGGDRVALALATGGLSEVFLHERKKLGNKYRTALSATVVAYIDTVKQVGQDPLGMGSLNPAGAVFLGWELEQKLQRRMGEKDSVWWVVLKGSDLSIKSTTPLADDLSQWKKALNKQLKEWDVRSEVKKLRNKRRRNGFIIAGIVVAIAVITIFTFGAGTGPSVAGAAVAANTMAGATVGVNASAAAAVATGGAVTGAAAGGGGVVAAGGTIAAFGPKVIDYADKAAKVGTSVSDIAQGIKANMPAANAAALEAEAANAESDTDAALTSSGDPNDPRRKYVAPGVGAVAGGALAGFTVGGPVGVVLGAFAGGVAGWFAGKKL